VSRRSLQAVDGPADLGLTNGTFVDRSRIQTLTGLFVVGSEVEGS
jgi:hypothetical protein